MDYYRPALPNTLLNSAEQRKAPRKSLKLRVRVGTTHHGVVSGYTCDLSVGGLSVMIPMALAVDALCAIRFELFINGNPVHISGTGKVTYCSCSGLEGFRIGLKFKPQDANLQTLLNSFLAK